MGYQALLFCPDEKLARVVTQVFTELDFQVEAVNEPFAAVKKLMAQRYDAVVVDCENEQNATLLFKSARNSSSNQSSLALALVEGQAGVAKAYRIGANLVLTKPINVEQAKGTLRVARGLLRKNADAAAPAQTSAARPASTPKTTVSPAVSASKPQSPIAEPVVEPDTVFDSPEFDSALPAMAASAESHETPAAVPTPWSKISADAEPAMQIQHQSAAPEPPKPAAAAPVVPAAIKKPVPAMTVSQGAAAAPAPAKETPVPSEKKKTDSDLFEVREASVSTARSTEAVPVPAFGGLSDFHETDGSGGSKKILAIAAALVVVAGLGYVGYTKFGKTSAVSTQPVAASPVSTPTPAPMASSQSVAVSSTPQAATPATQTTPAPNSSVPQNTKPSAAASKPAVSQVAVASEPVVTKPEPAPIHVKTQSTTSRPKPAAAAEEAAPQVPSPLGLAAANDKSLSGLVASAPVNIPRPAPGMLKISQGVSQGLLINRVQPRYPQNALAMRIQGAVQIEATINKEGKITNLKPTSGDPVLARAAMDAVRQWRYKPYFLDGEPVDIQTQITVNFKLPN